MSQPIYFSSRTTSFYELSNFAPFGFEEDGLCWPTVEHYFQAQKFVLPEGAEHRERIRTAATPKQAKSLGRSRAHRIRAGWGDVRDAVMRHARAGTARAGIGSASCLWSCGPSSAKPRIAAA